MTQRPLYRHRNDVDYVHDGVGLDPTRDVVTTSISAIDPLSQTLPADVTEVGGTPQSAVDIADKIEQLADALVAAYAGDDELRMRLYTEDASQNVAAIQGQELGTALGGTETALVTYLAQALASIGNDNLQIDIENASITTPADIQDSLEKKTENYGADIQSNTTEKTQLDGYATAEVLVKNITTATDVTVEKSWDDSNWFDVDSATGTTDYEETFVNVTAKYVRVTVTGTGGADTADIIVGGTL